MMDWLETKPEAGYAAWLNPQRSNVPATFWDAMQRQYQSAYSRYLGELGRSIMGDEPPTLRWMDYLQRQDPLAAYRNLSYYQQGVQSQAPMFRFVGSY